MSVTIKEIAKIAGVSRGTVDRALNNRDGVNEEVAKKVLAIAKALGYTPNTVGKALSLQKQQRKIAVILNSIGNPFFEPILAGIEKASKEVSDFGFQITVKEFNGFNVEVQLNLLDEVESDDFDYLAIAPINSPLIASRLAELSQKGIVILTINNDIELEERVAYVGCDYWKSGKTAAGLFGLITGGEANVGIITGSVHSSGHNARIGGFQEVIKTDFPKINIVKVVENFDDDTISYRVVKELFAEDNKIDSLYFTAAGTKGGLQAVCDLGLAGRVKIITFDMTPEVKHHLEIGTIAATICQQQPNDRCRPYKNRCYLRRGVYPLCRGGVPSPPVVTGRQSVE